MSTGISVRIPVRNVPLAALILVVTIIIAVIVVTHAIDYISISNKTQKIKLYGILYCVPPVIKFS